MEAKSKLLIVFLGWLILNTAAYFFDTSSNNQLVYWMILQQLWLIFGSLAVIKDRRIFEWDFREATWGFIAGLGLFILNSLINASTISWLGNLYGTEQVTHWLGQEQAGVQLLLEVDEPLWFIVAFLITVGAPLGEELLFRGAFLSELRSAISDKWGIFITAFCFALVHFYVIQFIPVFISGLILGMLFVTKGNLMRPLIAHATVNIITLLIYIL